MANIYFTDFFEVPPADLEAHGAFDISLINDLPVFVDPFLLFNSADPVYQELHERLIDYMKFLKAATLRGGLNDGLIQAWFAFPEVRQNWLGFSVSGNHGHGLGRGFANSLHTNFANVFRDFGEEIITKSSHIEKLCLVRDGVGRDNLSDFTTNLIKGYLANYTQDFARNALAASQRRVVPVPKTWFNKQTNSWANERFELPFIQGEYVLLTPKDMLTKDDAWISRMDLIGRLEDIAASLPDEVLRAQINEYIYQRLSELTDEPSAKQMREILGSAVDAHPRVLDYYIKDREDSGEVAASIANARIGEVEQQLIQHVKEVVSRVVEPSGFYDVTSNTFEEAKARLQFLKDVIENKGGHKIFFVDGQPVRRESDLQILYRLVWFASPSAVSREIDDGRGPVDFQVARGASDKTLIEFKLAKNTQLARNLERQCAVYERASNPTHPSLKAIVCFTEEEQDKVARVLADLGLIDDENIVVIDARGDNKPSGSKA